MRTITKIAGLFFSAFFAIGLIALAFITLLPAMASKPNMLDYYSVCSFAPVSTIILFSFSIVFVLLGLRMLKSSMAHQIEVPTSPRIIAHACVTNILTELSRVL